MSGSNISMKDSNSNINNYINGSDLNIEKPSSIRQNSSIGKIQQISETNNTMTNNDNSPIGNFHKSKINKNWQIKVKNIGISKEEKEKSFFISRR